MMEKYEGRLSEVMRRLDAIPTEFYLSGCEECLGPMADRAMALELIESPPVHYERFQPSSPASSRLVYKTLLMAYVCRSGEFVIPHIRPSLSEEQLESITQKLEEVSESIAKMHAAVTVLGAGS